MGPEGNIELYRLIEAWNPLKSDGDMDYDAEIYDTVNALYDNPSRGEAAVKIQNIFTFSFLIEIPVEDIYPMVDKAHHIIEIYKS